MYHDDIFCTYVIKLLHFDSYNNDPGVRTCCLLLLAAADDSSIGAAPETMCQIRWLDIFRIAFKFLVLRAAEQLGSTAAPVSRRTPLMMMRVGQTN